MQRKSLSVLLILIVIMTLTVGLVQADNVYNAEYGDITLHYIDTNPIKFSLENAEDGSFKALLKTENQGTETVIETDGSFELSETVKVNSARLRSKLDSGGQFRFRFEGQKLKLMISGQGKGKIIASPDMGDVSHDTKNVETQIRLEAEKGLLRVNNEQPKLTLPTDEERISRSLGVSKDRARELIGEHGTERLLNASQAAHQLGKRNGNGLLKNEDKTAAGGGGGLIQNGGSVDIKSLDPSNVFRFFLLGPSVKASLENSKFRMKVLGKQSQVSVKGLPATLTISGPVNGGNPDPNDVVLMDNITFDKEEGYYFYHFQEDDFLVSPDQLEPGGYDLHVDFGQQLKHLKLGITINDNLQVFSGRY